MNREAQVANRSEESRGVDARRAPSIGISKDTSRIAEKPTQSIPPHFAAEEFRLVFGRVCGLPCLFYDSHDSGNEIERIRPSLEPTAERIVSEPPTKVGIDPCGVTVCGAKFCAQTGRNSRHVFGKR